MNRRCKLLLISTLLLLLLPLLVSCQNHDGEKETKRQRFKNISRYVDEDGWVYTCDYVHYSVGETSPSVAPVVFNVINLRYRGESSIQILGDGVSPETDRDMREIEKFLGYDEPGDRPSIKEILAQDRSTLKLEVLDEELFFKLFDETMDAEPRTQGKYIEYSTYAFLREPGYEDGYQFQIGFCLGMGYIDVIMIDVLYQDSSSPKGYIQLYDLVRNGTATEEQLSLYETIRTIEEGIVSENNFCYGKSQFSSKKIASCDLARLYQFLSAIEANNYGQYRIPS